MSTSYREETDVQLDSSEELYGREVASIHTPVRVDLIKTAPVAPSPRRVREPLGADTPLPEIELPPQPAPWTAVARRGILTLTPLVLADVAALLFCGLMVELVAPTLLGADATPSLKLGVLGLLPLVLAYWWSGLYSQIWLHAVLELRHLTHVNTICLLAAAVGGMMAPPFPFSCAIALALVLVVIPTSRRLVRKLVARHKWWGYPTLIIGSAEGADAAARMLLRFPTSGLRPVLMTDPERGPHESVRPLINDAKVLEERVRSEGIQHAIISMPHLSADRHSAIIDRYTGLVPRLLVLSDAPVFPVLWGASRGCGGISGIEVRNGALLLTVQALKRVADVAIALTTVLLSLPLFAIIAVLVKFSSPGKVFFGHTRIGRHGRRFKAWKFRTMYEGADQILRDHLECNPAACVEWECHQKLRNDPRVTPVGRLLRCTSLDELPQTFNVLLGEMSVVGPRPIIDEEICRYGDTLKLYVTVKPGITGLWQVSGRNDVSYERRVQLDQFYIRHWSPWLDIHILAKTVLVLIRRKGAY